MSASNYESAGRIAPLPAGEEWLAAFAKLVVIATLVLIFIGGLVTSWQAGMAVPDWPLSFGSMNPQGWWENFPVRLEHGHRLTAMLVGLLTGALCAWIWQCWPALLYAAIVSAVLPPLAHMAGASRILTMHLAIWPAAAVFIAAILLRPRSRPLVHRPSVRWLAFSVFLCVCIQATFGGLRVTEETAGSVDLALVLRIAHGSFAQLFVLCQFVALATILSPVWGRRRNVSGAKGLRKLAWVAFALLALQLVLGAAMRHLGAGLAIPSFPRAASSGSWLPPVHNAFVDLNFTHTRAVAVLAVIVLVSLAIAVIRRCGSERPLFRAAATVLALVLLQFTLGVLVIQIQTPPLSAKLAGWLQSSDPANAGAFRGIVASVKTAHMFNGAILLSATLLLAMRLSGSSSTLSSGGVSRVEDSFSGTA